MNEFTITPSVDETQEFIEIANDFSNPLDIVREAISNSFDANARKVEIYFRVLQDFGESILEIIIKDDGIGMDKEGLQSFFDLGNSKNRGNQEKIGEKGHGTKVFFNSTEIKVITRQKRIEYTAILANPIKNLHKRTIPPVTVKSQSTEKTDGTEIFILGYNANRRDRFTHDILKDYILWFTKFGSFEERLGIENLKNSTLILQGLGRNEPEEIRFGHIFPPESKPVNDLFEQHLVAAPDHYCKQLVRSGHLKKFPEIAFEAIFSVEGNKVKQQSNPMLRRGGKNNPAGSYTVQERYGVWLCKDFIPVQRKNEWITYKGNEFIKFHAFFNCQKLRLTANRGSIDNTPTEYLDDIKNEIKSIFDEIVESDDWRQLAWLEQEADAYKTSEKEKKDFDWRKKKINKTNIAKYKNVILVEPERESGVFALVIQLSTIENNLFPFHILDYDTHSGIDVIAKGDKTTPITLSKLCYVEFKYYLTEDFNHSFLNLHSVVCWETQLKHNSIAKDIAGDERKFEITQPRDNNDYTHYYLTDSRSSYRIEVYVLKT
ncbi:MAG: hypothetical protein EPO24_01350 [Bacteroidetes bacterium]|nr:MAG: hypothetical protein EPO24_01350 [Bacteroidota bacterium]